MVFTLGNALWWLERGRPEPSLRGSPLRSAQLFHFSSHHEGTAGIGASKSYQGYEFSECHYHNSLICHCMLEYASLGYMHSINKALHVFCIRLSFYLLHSILGTGLYPGVIIISCKRS